MTTSPASPLDRLVTLPEGLPDLTLGWEFLRWGVKYLKHPNGPRAGKRWEWVNSQIWFFLWWYAVDEDGHWLFHHGVRRLAKGTGKSPGAATWALGEFTAPVRLEDFDPKAPGGCVGRPVHMPLVQIAATAESQTSNTMRMVRAFAPKKSRLVEEFGLDPGKTQYYKLPEGELKVITSSATAAEGAEATGVVGDETENWRPENGGVELASTLEDNLAKSGSRMLETSNAWVPGRGSVAEDTYDAWVAQEEGRTRGESRILYDARMWSPDTDMGDERSLRRALDFVYDDCWWVDRRFIMNRIWDSRSRPDESKRKYGNRPTVAEDAWTTPEEWSVLADPKRVVADGEEIALFFDGSKSRDATALVGCTISDGHVFPIDMWEPDTRHDTESVVPVAHVDFTVRQTAVRFKVLGFFGDVQEWESFVKVEWPEVFPDLLVHALPTGRQVEPVAWDMRSRVFEFTQAAELCEAEIRERKFTHDGDSRLMRHVVNMRRRPNRWGTSVGKESPSSPRKIDGGVCVIGVRHVRRMVMSSPRWKKRRNRTGEAVFF